MGIPKYKKKLEGPLDGPHEEPGLQKLTNGVCCMPTYVAYRFLQPWPSSGRSPKNGDTLISLFLRLKGPPPY